MITLPDTPTVLITTLAMYQTEFWAKVGESLKAKGRLVAYLSFDDRSTELLLKRGFHVFSVNQEDIAAAENLMLDFDRAMGRFGITDVNHWLSHERITFNLHDGDQLRHRLLTYLVLADRTCKELMTDGRVTLMQELGGFVSVVATYFAARNLGIDNWFIEPSFFRGRLFFLKNSFSALRIPAMPDLVPSKEVITYLQNTQASKAIVVPLKDKHQYTSAFRKIVNWYNAKRLVQKLVDKHLLQKHQEFGHIGAHVSRHASMLLNSLRLRDRYKSVGQIGPFIYYPLHVPADMALTVRSPEYLDQLALIDYLARNIPHTHLLAIKEHPAMIGAVDATRLKKLLSRYDNLVLIAPQTNNYEVLQACDAIISVNSKSGAEALLLGKPVLVLGDAFYRNAPMAIPIEAITDLPGTLKSRLVQHEAQDQDALLRYFERVWCHTYEGELYVQSEQNISKFTYALTMATSK